ncbi:phosphate ABC transporter permease PstA [Klugiella sp. YN-L-19]|uniref:Phosphate transport system permease protein PstA n=2 Tax=Ruicaihuangia caeni TaxID=3042517 RepID=A0AAW6T6L9_9MICO|nr:phosphate ABC transporter permease PstA [Klugiella sp. YN-L-19]MDI2098716.1 phosphate ABC transporter permease PstA [Klugiella sp. YN-L-19]
MTTTQTRTDAAHSSGNGLENAYAHGRLGRRVPWLVLGATMLLSIVAFALLAAAGSTDGFNIVGAIMVGALGYGVVIFITSLLVEGMRQAKDRLVTALVTTAFIIALLPLISLLYTVVVNGLPRFDVEFFTWSMRSVVGEGGGAVHAIVGTLLMTLTAAVISVPIGLMTSIYLVEYSRGGPLSRAINFFVDVMTGIPSIVAGLFAYAVFALIFGPGIRLGIAGAIALAVLMIPVVVRSSEDMLKLVPNELREASYALGVPKWLTVLKIVLPTAMAGITTGVMLAIARVIGESAPLLVAAGFTANLNYDLFDGRMQSLPLFVYNSYIAQGTDAQAYLDRAWAGALTLILIVMALNLLARLIAKIFSPKKGR